MQGSPRVYKALRDQLKAVLEELKRIEARQEVDQELRELIEWIATILFGMKEADYGS